MKRTLVLLLLCAAGCSNDPDALYTKTSSAADSGAAATPEPLPQLPARPDDDHQADCERCAKSTCSEARTNCLEDDACTAELRCKGQCSDPACLQTCSAEHGFSPWYSDYANCVFGQCPTECNTGNNWQCQRHYDWPAAQTSHFEVRFRFDTPPTFFLGTNFPNNIFGQSIRACPDVSDCANSAQDSGQVGIDEKVKLELDANSIPPRDFRGYLEIDGGSEHQRVYLAPLARSQEYFAAYPPFPPVADPARARVQVAVADCLGAPVSGALVTLPDMPKVPAFAADSQLTWSEGPTTGIGLATLVNLPDSAADSQLRVHAERRDGQGTISERAVWVRPGFATFLILAPAAISN